jgi:hypothetical protein
MSRLKTIRSAGFYSSPRTVEGVFITRRTKYFSPPHLSRGEKGMGEVSRDELTDFVRLAESINDLIIKLYDVLGEITFKSKVYDPIIKLYAMLGEIAFKFEVVFTKSAQPIIEFVNDYVSKRKEAFAISYHSDNKIEVIHKYRILFYVPFTEDPGKISLQELYEHIFSDPAVKDVVLKTAVIQLVELLQKNLKEVKNKIDLKSSMSYLKLAIKKAKDPAVLNEAKLLLADAVILMDEFSWIHKEIESLIKKLEQVNSVSQLEGVIRDLNLIIDMLERKKHLIEEAELVAKKAETLAIFVEEFAHVIENIKKEAEKQYAEEESEDE